MNKSKKIIKILITLCIAYWIISSPSYANTHQDIKVEVNTNVMKMNNRRLPSTYLGTMKRNIGDYNLAEALKLNVKNQGDLPICWACSSNSVLETTINLAQQTNYIFSEETLQQNVKAIYGEEASKGGNSFVAYGHYTSGNSPITVEGEETNIKIEDYTIFSSIYKKATAEGVKHYKSILSNETYTQEEVELIRNNIKQHILTKGAVTALTYIDGKYFTEDMKSYYCDSMSGYPNHQITIVGWNDEYMASNFKNKGAYIVMNSYGEEFGESGFYYISYDDVYIEYSNFGINEVSTYEKDDNIYQYDELGTNQELTFTKDIYGANRYTRETDKLEKLTSITLTTLQNGEYDVFINPIDGTLNWKNFKKVKSVSIQKAGYNKIEFDPIFLHGEEFVVAVKSKATSTSKVNIGIENNEGGMWQNVTNKENQSYFSLDTKNWIDIQDLEEDIIGLKDANISIKAFTQETTLGDINLDEKFDIRDLSLALQYFGQNLEQDLNNKALENLEINEDGVTDIRDLSKMILIIANMQ